MNWVRRLAKAYFGRAERSSRRGGCGVRQLTTVFAAGGVAWMLVHCRSSAVLGWKSSSLARRRVGGLCCRVGGSGETGVLLLHGLVATGDVFGVAADVLATSRVVAVPDLLGFGHSLDEDRADFGTEAHLAALDAVIAEVLGARPLVIAAHSMGCTLALRWAGRHPDRVERVICIGAPIWPTRAAARRAIGGASPMSRALVVSEPIARYACALSCRHRTLSGWIAAAVAPRWPSPIARQASLHTWPAFHQAVEHQVLHGEWPALLARLDAAGVPVRLVWGDRDRVADRGYGARLADSMAHVTVQIIKGADHTLPTARPELIVELSGLSGGM